MDEQFWTLGTGNVIVLALAGLVASAGLVAAVTLM